MDLAFFLKERTSFVRSFYAEGRKPFDAIMQQIEDEVPPFKPPPCDPEYSDGEPPFLKEYLDADMAVNVLGQTCVSMLSDTLKLYFQELEREFGFKPTEEAKRELFKKEGFLNGYKKVLTEILDTDWKDCPVDFGILEQIVLVRNRAQHGGNLMGFDIFHTTDMLDKNPELFLVDPREKTMAREHEKDEGTWFKPSIQVSQAELLKAIEEIERLANWIAERQGFAHAWRSGKRSK